MKRYIRCTEINNAVVSPTPEYLQAVVDYCEYLATGKFAGADYTDIRCRILDNDGKSKEGYIIEPYGDSSFWVRVPYYNYDNSYGGYSRIIVPTNRIDFLTPLSEIRKNMQKAPWEY